MPSLASPSRSIRHRGVAAHRWQRRSSPLARYALLAYALIVVDASLFPFAAWRDLGIGPFDYLAADWPRRLLPFDFVVNAIGYAPLGFLLVLALHPAVRGVWSVALATLVAGALSIGLEAVQTYLPARVASKVDVASNLLGAVVGAIVAARFAHALLDTGRLRMWRARWFASDASRGLVLSVVWFGALIYPDAFVFGLGGVFKVLDPAWTAWLASLAGLTNGSDAVATAYRFEVAEATIAALTLTGAGLLFFGLLRASHRWPFRAGLLALFVVATVVVKALAHAFLFDEGAVWPWLTQGAREGVAFAAVALIVASLLPRRMRWALAIASFGGALVLVNLYPDNPYVTAVATSWTRGKLMNFYGLASGLNLVWPYVAIAYLLRHRGDGSVRPARRGGATASSL